MRLANRGAVQYFTECARAAAAVLLLLSACAAQKPAASQPPIPFSEELNKYPGLAPELGRLTDDLKREVKFPPPRRESTILPLLPAAANYYVALPNYGEVARQSLATLNRHLESSAVLRGWWQSNSVAPKMQEFLQKFGEISEYLGDEIVVFGETGNKNRSFVIVAEVRKPGLKDLLKEIWRRENRDLAPAPIFDIQELAAARPAAADQVRVLVRPDYLVVARNLESLRDFNSFLDARTKAFATSAFGKRVQHAYEGGVSTVLAADAQSILNQTKIADKRNQELLQRSGFSDMEYAVWQYKQEGEHSGSAGELSFTGARRGAAAWLAPPGKIEGLDFVSPRAGMAGGMLLKNFAEIYSDIQSLASVSNPQALLAITPFERMLNISLKDDLLALFPGEIVWELQGLPDAKPEWTVILRVTDADHLQATLQKIFTMMRWQTSQFEDNGTIYNSITMPSPQRPSDNSGTMPPTQQPSPMVYTMADGYLLVASSRESAIEAVRAHKSGESLAKSSRLQAVLPAGNSSDVSALFYEDPAVLMANNIRQLSPDMAQMFTKMSTARSPVTFRAYGEQAAIRSVSSSDLGDPSALLVVAAIAIPNLLRARIAANDSSAIGSLRTINTAEFAYRVAYPDKGFARDLASLGPDPRGAAFSSPEHGGMIDATLGDSTCAAGAWCQKSGYRFNVAAVCKSRAAPCGGFVVTATPLSGATGTRNFCSTSDAIVRFKLGAPLTDPVTMSECRQWSALPK